jgi:hypothetical protein
MGNTIPDPKITRESNRKNLHRLLNPALLSAEQNKGVKNYPMSGWQDEGSTGRWDGFRALWGTYKVVHDQDHSLAFVAYVPENISEESCPLLISWHGGGFVRNISTNEWNMTDYASSPALQTMSHGMHSMLQISPAKSKR